MKSIEIEAADSLEETLSCDDIFLEYFNLYLSLPAFPQRLCYSRFTGTFHDLDKETVPVAPIRQEDDIVINLTGVNGRVISGKIAGGVGSKTSVYAAKEDERERVIKWAREYRLPLFQDTKMYRELKLCKLLLRPLDMRRGSSRIRGYSRLSMGFATTTSLISGTGRNESPSRVLTSLDNQSSGDWHEINSTKYGATTGSRPSSRAFSISPTLGLEKTWSATALYDTSATNTSGTNPDEMMARPRNHRRRYPITSPASRMQDQSQASRTQMYSDSGLGTTALDYPQSVGTSVKTRNVNTRADTLGVGSRWDSEEEYGERLADSRAITAMTSSTISGDGYITPASATAWNISKYGGKSALRTADSPSKPHRATIVLPKTRSINPVVRIVAGSSTEYGTTTMSTSETKQEEVDDDITYDETNDDELDDDFDVEDGDFLDFDDRESSCEETETEIATIEKVHSMSMQHIKERIFRTKSGMDSFLRFLQGTAGEHLVEFWLDTEAFKDSVTKYEERGCITPHLTGTQPYHDKDAETALRLRRHRLFRHILDRHKFILTDEAREQIRLAQANEGLSHRVFYRSQYDVLRRLRSYWLPRFVIHKEADPTFKQRLVSGNWEEDDAYVYNPPVNDKAISALPIFSIGYLNFNEETTSDSTNLSVQTLESATTQSVITASARPCTSQIRMMSARSASFHFAMRAMIAEAEAGFPLRNYLKSRESRTTVNTYDFLMSLEYLAHLSTKKFLHKTGSEKSSLAVILDGVEAYSLYSTFLSKSSPCNIKVPRKLSLVSLEKTLKGSTAVGAKHTTVSSSIFRHVKHFSLTVISGCLKKFQEFEVSNYYETREGKPREFPTQPDKIVAPVSKSSSRADESSTTLSETTSGISKPWFTDDDTTETDSASTMYSYDVERLKQLAQSIRKKGAKKPQRTPPKKVAPKKKLLKRGTTAAKGHQASKVQFNLPEEEQKNIEVDDHDQLAEDNEEEEEEGSEEEKKRKKEKKKSKLFQHPNRMTFVEIKENKLLYTFFRKYVLQCESVEIQNIMQMYQLCDALMMIPSHEFDRKNVISSELVRTFLHPSGPKQIAMPSERTAQFYGELPSPSDESIRTLQDYVAPTLDQAASNFSLGFGTLLKEYKLTLKSDLGQHMNKAELALRSLTLKPSSKRRKALGKHSARQTPTSEHKIMFVEALERAQEGSLPVDLIHFYKYLQGFGPQEGFPLIHNDLLFYVEVSKFVASYHEDYDLVTLKRKILSIRDCFIDTNMEKTLQIDIKTGTAERLRRAMDAFVLDRGRDPHVPTLFDDAQHTVFNELLPFWAGFVTAMTPSEREGKRPVLKSERMQRRRLEAFLKTKDPKVEFEIPGSQPKFDMKGIEFTFSVNGGIQWKAWSDVSSSRSSTPPVTGIIEVVKAPPTGQRRIVRRSGFTIRKLQTSKDKEQATRKPAFPSPAQDHSASRTLKPKAAKRLAEQQLPVKRVTYATSVC